jgi:uncharacterized protein YgbK (DUF1537 family)
VAARLAQGLLAAVRNLQPATVLVSGGDTLAAFLREARCRHLPVGGEIAPGLVWCDLPLNKTTIRLLAKSGGFGGPETLLELFRQGTWNDR